jgi:hypothetical protein
MNQGYYHSQNGRLRQDFSLSPYARANALDTSPWPNTGNDTVDKVKAWLDKPTFPTAEAGSFTSKIHNKHLALAGSAAALAGLVWYGNKKRWFK